LCGVYSRAASIRGNTVCQKEESFLQPSPDATVLFVPFRCTHPVPTPPIVPFLLKQNLSPKDIGRRDTEAERLIGTMGPKGLT